jgi:hypothetical protein
MLEEVHFVISRSCTAKVLPQVSKPFSPVNPQTLGTHIFFAQTCPSRKIHPTHFHKSTMASKDDAFSSPLFVPQDSPELGVGSDNHHLGMPFEELDLDMQLEAPDVDMDHIDDLDDVGNPEPKPVNIGRSIFRLPAAGHTFLVGTQKSQLPSQPQESVAIEQSEDVKMMEEPMVGGDVAFSSPATLSPLAAFDFDFDMNTDAFSFGESHMDTEMELPTGDPSVAEPHEDLSIAQPHITHEVEPEFFPSFATDVGQPEFNFGQPDDFATETNQGQLLIDQQSSDAGREVRQESAFSAQFPFDSSPPLQSVPEDQVAPAPAIEREQADSALLPLSSQALFDAPSLRSEGDDSPAPALVLQRDPTEAALSSPRSQTPSNFPSLKSESSAPTASIEREPTNSVLSPSTSHNAFHLPAVQPKSEEQATPARTIKREPASATLSPFTSRAERARRAKLNAIKSEVAEQEHAVDSSMALPQTNSACTRSGKAKEDTELKEVLLLSSKVALSGKAKEKKELREATHLGNEATRSGTANGNKLKEATLTDSEATRSGTAKGKKEAALLSSDAFSRAARTRERSGTPFGIQPWETPATNSIPTPTQAETAIDNAYNKFISPNGVRVPGAMIPTRAQRRQNERNQQREDKRTNNETSNSNGNNDPIPSMSISQPTNNPIPNFSNPTAPPPSFSAATAPTPEALIAAAHKQLDNQAQKYRDLEHDACDREEQLAEIWALSRQLRVKAIEERCNALVVIRHRRRQLDAMRGLSAQEVVEGDLTDLMRPLFVEKEPQAGTEEFERMVIEGQEVGVEDDGYETPPYGG